MVTHLFEGFMEDPELFRACEEYWARLVEDLATALGQTGEWKPWLPRTYGNGTPMDPEDREICEGRSARLDRAFRVYQGPPSRRDIPEVAAWLTAFEEEYTELPRNDLAIGLSLSEETAAVARRLLRKWMEPSTTPGEMDPFIERVLAEAGALPLSPDDDALAVTPEDASSDPHDENTPTR